MIVVNMLIIHTEVVQGDLYLLFIRKTYQKSDGNIQQPQSHYEERNIKEV